MHFGIQGADVQRRSEEALLADPFAVSVDAARYKSDHQQHVHSSPKLQVPRGVFALAMSKLTFLSGEKRLFSFWRPTATNRQYPVLGTSKVRSAMTNPTRSTRLLDGRNGITIRLKAMTYTSLEIANGPTDCAENKSGCL